MILTKTYDLWDNAKDFAIPSPVRDDIYWCYLLPEAVDSLGPRLDCHFSSQHDFDIVIGVQ